MNELRSAFARWKRDGMIAAGAGLTTALCIGTATFLLGTVGDAQARILVDAILPTSRLLCSSVLTVTATVLALMLTLLGLGNRAEVDLGDAHYHRIKKIAFYDALTFSFTTILFLFHCVPIQESDKIPGWWYPTVYYGILSSAAIVAGSVVTIVVMLYLAVSELVEVIGLNPDKSETQERG